MLIPTETLYYMSLVSIQAERFKDRYTIVNFMICKNNCIQKTNMLAWIVCILSLRVLCFQLCIEKYIKKAIFELKKSTFKECITKLV